MTHRRLKKGPRIVLIVLAVAALIGAAWHFIPPLFVRPTFTLFIRSTDPSHDPSKIVVGVVANPAGRWDWERHIGRDAQAHLWMRQIGSGSDQKLFGNYVIKSDELSFIPAAPLIPGSMYRVTFAAPNLGRDMPLDARVGIGSISGRQSLELIHHVPSVEGEASRVEELHPTADELPANQLKFYIVFSEPMEQNVFMERIKLLRPDGSEIAGPFRETELWSPDGRRLTVWLHPGRQKTGVNLNEDEGPVLREGDNITLVISGDWRSTSGQKLGADFKKTFRVTKADHEQPDPSKWTVHPPKAGTMEPLRAEFPEPLDWALLQNSLSVFTTSGSRIEGQIEVATGEREWRMTPATNWSAGDAAIKIDPVLEDLAGNNLNGPFEVDVAASTGKGGASVTELRFRVE